MSDHPLHLPLDEIFLLGPTASGKDATAALLASALAARGVATEILCLDSMKVYRGLDVLSDAPMPADRAHAGVRYHMLGVASPDESYSAGRYVADAARAVHELRGRGAIPLFVGGTMLYYRALVDGLFEGPPADPDLRAALEAEHARDATALHERLRAVDPETAARVHVNDCLRIVRALEVFASCGRPQSELASTWRGSSEPAPAGRRVLGILPDWEELRERVAWRSRKILAGGREGVAAREVAAVLATCGFSRQSRVGVGVREAIGLLEGSLTQEEAVAELTRRTRRLAKAQRTWFRSLTGVEWHHLAPGVAAPAICELLLETLCGPASPRQLVEG